MTRGSLASTYLWTLHSSSAFYTLWKGDSLELLRKPVAKPVRLPYHYCCHLYAGSSNTASASERFLALPPLAMLDSGVLEISSKDPTESECSADGRFRGGNGDISVSLVSCARVSFRRRLLRLLFGVFRESSDTDFLRPGLSDYSKRNFGLVFLCTVSS